VLAALGAALLMDNVAHVRNDKQALRDASRDPQTWISAFCASA
jgi:NNP family nitrate/nitrite transporter-like MFS transporter